MIITGNKEKGLAKELFELYPDAMFCSRSNGFDLCSKKGQKDFANLTIEHEIIILNSALYRFEQTNLLNEVYESCVKIKHIPFIICIGSTTDRVKNSKPWIYNAEKKALRDFCNTLSLGGVWSDKPKVTYVSFGTLSNNAEKHPTRKCMNINLAANYIKWIIDQPKDVCVNEISIDPMQSEIWYE